MTIQWHSFGEVTSKLRPKNEEDLPRLIAVERHSRKRDQQYTKEGKKGRWKSLTFQVEHPIMSKVRVFQPFLVSHGKARGIQLSSKRILSRTIKWLFSERECSISPFLYDSSLSKYLHFWALSTFSTERMKWWSLFLTNSWSALFWILEKRNPVSCPCFLAAASGSTHFLVSQCLFPPQAL